MQAPEREGGNAPNTGMGWHTRLACWVAACGPIGYAPLGPGTAAALVVVVVLFLASPFLGDTSWAVLLVVTIAVGQWACVVATRRWGDDPKKVVIDEVAGQLIALSWIAAQWELYVLGFILFRLFDILKPWPVNRIDQKKASWSVMGDDLAAGAMARLLLFLISTI